MMIYTLAVQPISGGDMQPDYLDRVLMLEGGSNIRDLGGYPTSDGKTTRWKTILRSGAMDQLTPIGQQGLLDYGVKHIVDLREAWEAEKFPNVFMKSSLINYSNCPLIGSESTNRDIESLSSLSAMYIHMLEQCQSQIKIILETIATQLESGCVLFQCWAGKDRTGIIAALLLSNARLPADIIANEYSVSHILLTERIQEWRSNALSSGRDMQRFEEDVSSRPETMLEILHYIEHHVGGIETYMRSIGLADEKITSLRTLMVE
jgi:protein-tyrosine phosphatase